MKSLFHTVVLKSSSREFVIFKHFLKARVPIIPDFLFYFKFYIVFFSLVPPPSFIIVTAVWFCS